MSPWLKKMTAICMPVMRIKQPIGGAVVRVRLEEPVGQDAILGNAVEDAVGADDGGVDGAGQDQEADDDDEAFEEQLEHVGPDDVPGQAADQVFRVELHAHFIGNQEHGEKADARGKNNAVDEDDERGLLEVEHLRRFDFAINLGQRLLAAHRQDRMPERDQEAQDADAAQEIAEREEIEEADRVVLRLQCRASSCASFILGLLCRPRFPVPGGRSAPGRRSTPCP